MQKKKVKEKRREILKSLNTTISEKNEAKIRVR